MTRQMATWAVMLLGPAWIAYAAVHTVYWWNRR